MFVIVMGVAGSGKTAVGRGLARRLGCAFLDADGFHPAANVAKMSRGEALTDDDRWPWLDAMRQALIERAGRGESAVLACSALKRAYRERVAGVAGVAGGADVQWVYLRVSRAIVYARLTGRADHFMPAELIDSQFATLEEPADALHVDGELPLADVVAMIVNALDKQ